MGTYYPVADHGQNNVKAQHIITMSEYMPLHLFKLCMHVTAKEIVVGTFAQPFQ